MNKETIENATKTADRGLEREGDSCEGNVSSVKRTLDDDGWVEIDKG
jgi:hypothetical protein